MNRVVPVLDLGCLGWCMILVSSVLLFIMYEIKKNQEHVTHSQTKLSRANQVAQVKKVQEGFEVQLEQGKINTYRKQKKRKGNTLLTRAGHWCVGFSFSAQLLNLSEQGFRSLTSKLFPYFLLSLSISMHITKQYIQVFKFMKIYIDTRMYIYIYIYT